MADRPDKGPGQPPPQVTEALAASPLAILRSELAGDPDKPITPQQALFVAEYCKDFNASRAAKAAHYSENSAASQGARLLKHANILRAISETTSAMLAASGESPARTILDLRKIIDSPATEPREKIKALELLGRYHGQWTGGSESNRPSITFNLNFTGSSSATITAQPGPRPDEVIDVAETGGSEDLEPKTGQLRAD